MAVNPPASLNVDRLRAETFKIYARVAAEPSGDFHFHRGPAYAASFLGYSQTELARLPAFVTESFAGVGNPLSMGEPTRGQRVVDIGSGAGTDSLLAAKTGATVIGVDPTDAMLDKARRGASELGYANAEFRKGMGESLPVESNSVDLVISNGVLNLSPCKTDCFKEIVRVLKPGGRLQLTDIVVERELSEKTRSDIDLWTG
jgi:SAM-dependent methyltransferase